MKIYSAALQLADLQKSDVVWDLYCGIGTFGMLAARHVREVIGVELSKESAYDATTNKKRLQIANFTVLEGDVSAMIGGIPKQVEELGLGLRESLGIRRSKIGQ